MNRGGRPEIKRVFISFDYDNDKDLPGNLRAQAARPDSPFSIIDQSLQESVDEKWREEVRKRIRNSDLVIVMCGEHTDQASGVTAELTITREEDKPYFLLKGRMKRTCKPPKSALRTDKMHQGTWANLVRLIGGERRL